MTVRSLFLLPGDGIGPEAMAEVRKLIDYMNSAHNAGFTVSEGLVGGSAYDAHGVAISDADMEKALAADAILFGAVGARNGMASPTSTARKPVCCVCARISSFSPTCAPPSATRRSPPPLR